MTKTEIAMLLLTFATTAIAITLGLHLIARLWS
jgi:fatty-acid desaturase